LKKKGARLFWPTESRKIFKEKHPADGYIIPVIEGSAVNAFFRPTGIFNSLQRQRYNTKGFPTIILAHFSRAHFEVRNSNNLSSHSQQFKKEKVLAFFSSPAILYAIQELASGFILLLFVC